MFGTYHLAKAHQERLLREGGQESLIAATKGPEKTPRWRQRWPSQPSRAAYTLSILKASR
jgi:hypothetical protein